MDRNVLFKTIEDNPEYSDLYKTDMHFKKCIDYLKENNVSINSIVLCISVLCKLIKKNKIAFNEHKTVEAWDKIINHLFDKYCIEGKDEELFKLMEEHDAGIKNGTIDEVCQYICYEWSLDKINTCDDFEKIANTLHEKLFV